MDKVTFKIGLDIYLYYIIYYKDMAIEFEYLKPIFKNRKSSISIWKAIVLRLKGLIYFFKKKLYKLEYLYQSGIKMTGTPIL